MKFLTYAAPTIRNAMMDMVRMPLPLLSSGW